MSRLVFYTQVLEDGTIPGSARCRAFQISERIDSLLNPPVEEVRHDDIVVMVKHIKYEVMGKSKNIYCDVVDNGGGSLLEELKKYPEVKIITLTPYGCEHLKDMHNKCIWIPHHHCNFENRVRPDREVKTIGFQGSDECFPKKYWNKFCNKLKGQGFRIIKATPEQTCQSRMKCADFIYDCDILVSFRLAASYNRKPHYPQKYPLQMKSPTKLNNAGSFKIPYVSYPEHCFVNNYTKKGSFLPCDLVGEMASICLKLRDDKVLYKDISEKAYNDAKEYHIDNVVKYYNRLKGE